MSYALDLPGRRSKMVSKAVLNTLKTRNSYSASVPMNLELVITVYQKSSFEYQRTIQTSNQHIVVKEINHVSFKNILRLENEGQYLVSREGREVESFTAQGH